MLSVACHPGGGAFATGSSDAKIKLWDMQNRTCAQTIAEHGDQVKHGLNHSTEAIVVAFLTRMLSKFI